jgi:hypothetical protein
MRQLKFVGNPSHYGWYVNLENGKEYPENLIVFESHTLGQVIDESREESTSKNEAVSSVALDFLADWQEVKRALDENYLKNA